jgi:4-amino-4-deoxy-L-arabinose transferase-like glycosyltransferase
MAPWSFALPWAFQRHRSRVLSDRRLLFLLAWMIGPLVMFEAVRTKLVHYYLPAYPAVGLLLASAWAGRFGPAPRGFLTIQPWMGWMVVSSGVLIAVGFVAAGCLLFPVEFAVPASLVFALFGIGLILAGLLLAKRMPRAAFRSAVVGIWCAMFLAAVTIIPRVGQSRPIHEVTRRLAEHKNERIGFWIYRDPSIIFNLGGGVYPVVDPFRFTAPLVETRALASLQPFLCPLTPELLAEVRRDPALRSEVVETINKWDGGTLRNRTIHLVRICTPASAMAQNREPRFKK